MANLGGIDIDRKDFAAVDIEDDFDAFEEVELDAPEDGLEETERFRVLNGKRMTSAKRLMGSGRPGLLFLAKGLSLLANCEGLDTTCT